MITVNSDELTRLMQDSTPLLVEFGAPWCGPCRHLEPALDELEKELGHKLVIRKINIDDYPEAQIHFNFQSVPTTLLFVGGREVQRITGAMPKSRLLTTLSPNL